MRCPDIAPDMQFISAQASPQLPRIKFSGGCRRNAYAVAETNMSETVFTCTGFVTGRTRVHQFAAPIYLVLSASPGRVRERGLGLSCNCVTNHRL